ncbi:hypothetical protein HY501_03860 [Candidatus Woesearchaeota archaeon]|nr:hypothetical protein [Candidatus Woesearchaeota archaeon]
MKAYLFATEVRNPYDSSQMGKVWYSITYGRPQEPALHVHDLRVSYTMESLESLCYAIEGNVLLKPFRPKGKKPLRITALQNRPDNNAAPLAFGRQRPLTRAEVRSLTARVREALRR